MKKGTASALGGIILAIVILFASTVFIRLNDTASGNLASLFGIKKVCDETGKGLDYYEEKISEMESKIKEDPNVVFLDGAKISIICEEYKGCFPKEFKEQTLCKECKEKDEYINFIRNYDGAEAVVSIYDKFINCYSGSKEELKTEYLEKYEKELIYENKRIYRDFLERKFPELKDFFDNLYLEDTILPAINDFKVRIRNDAEGIVVDNSLISNYNDIFKTAGSVGENELDTNLRNLLQNLYPYSVYFYLYDQSYHLRDGDKFANNEELRNGFSEQEIKLLLQKFGLFKLMSSIKTQGNKAQCYDDIIEMLKTLEDGNEVLSAEEGCVVKLFDGTERNLNSLTGQLSILLQIEGIAWLLSMEKDGFVKIMLEDFKVQNYVSSDNKLLVVNDDSKTYRLLDGELYSLKAGDWINVEKDILSEEQIYFRGQRDTLLEKKINLKIDYLGTKDLKLSSRNGLYFTTNMKSYIYHFSGRQFIVSEYTNGQYGDWVVGEPSVDSFKKSLNLAGLSLDSVGSEEIYYLLAIDFSDIFSQTQRKFGLDDQNNFYESDGTTWNKYSNNNINNYLYVSNSEFEDMESQSERLTSIKKGLLEKKGEPNE